MKASLLLSGAAALALTIAGCNRSSETADTTAPADGTVAEAPMTDPAAATDPAQATLAFATDAANTDMLEIESSRVALEKSTNADVKKFAQTLIDQHTATSTELKAWAQTAGITLPTALDGAPKTSVDNLRTADATGFDDKYLDTVIDAHEDGIEKFDRYAREGQDAALKTWASTTLPKLQAHFTTAKTLREAVNKS